MNYLSLAEIIIVPVLVATITAAGSLTAILLSNRRQSARIKDESAKFREENTSQHNENRVALEESKIILTHLSGQIGVMDQKVDRLDQRLDNVQIWQSEHEKEHLNHEYNQE